MLRPTRMKLPCYLRRLHGTSRSVDSQVSECDAQEFAVHEHCILSGGGRRLTSACSMRVTYTYRKRSKCYEGQQPTRNSDISALREYRHPSVSLIHDGSPAAAGQAHPHLAALT